MYRKCWTFFLGYCCTRLELRLKWQMLVNMLSEAGLLGSSFSQEEASSCFYFFTFSQESLIRVVLCLRANARSKQGLFETFLPFPFSLSHKKLYTIRQFFVMLLLLLYSLFKDSLSDFLCPALQKKQIKNSFEICSFTRVTKAWVRHIVLCFTLLLADFAGNSFHPLQTSKL